MVREKPSRAPRQPAKAKKRRAASSLDRMLQLLDAFTSSQPANSTEELIKFIGTSRSTAYRYIRSLQKAGLLSPVANGSWMLGPRILELDLQLRQWDPLYIAGGPIMKRLVKRTGHTVLLCTLFSDAVICIRDERSPNAPAGLFSRGQRRPIFTAAASKIMLPYIPPHQLRRIYTNNQAAIAAAHLGHDWKSFRTELRAMRGKGCCVTVGEFQPGIVGIAAPVLSRSGNVLASIGFAFAESQLKSRQLDGFISLVKKAATELGNGIRNSEWVADLPARRVGGMRA